MNFVCICTLLAAAAAPCAAQYSYGGLFEPNYPGGAREPVTHHREPEYSGYRDEHDLDYHAHPKYAFDYSVKDPDTGDDKEHWETRDGDKVKGSYTILENDGTKRVVEYEADDKNGFNAVVHKIGHAHEHANEHVREHARRPAYEPPPHYNRGYEDAFVPISGYNHL